MNPRETDAAGRGETRVAGRTPKASFGSVYDAPTPEPYFAALRPLDYRTPMHAQPILRRALGELRRLRRRERVRMLDLCSGYGVNGALTKFDIGLDDLYRRYAGAAGPAAPEADRAAFAPRRARGPLPVVVGQDVAARALAYAEAAGFLDAAIAADLESRPLAPAEARLVAGTDLVTVTGGLSYIGAATIARILDALRRPPWVICFPLRGTDFQEIEETLEQAGLVAERWPRPFAHRRFADGGERDRTLSAIGARPADGLGPASTTHLEAVLHLARPADEAAALPLSELVLGRAAPRPRPREPRIGA